MEEHIQDPVPWCPEVLSIFEEKQSQNGEWIPLGKSHKGVSLHTSRQQHHPWGPLKSNDSQTPTPDILIQKLWKQRPKQLRV